MKSFNSTYDVVDIGYNYRLNEISSAILIQQLKKIQSLNMKRRKLALYYKKKINEYLNNIKIPFTKYIGNFLSYHIFKRLISLPLYPKLKKTEIDYIISKIASFLKK